MSLQVCEFLGTQIPKSRNNFPARNCNSYPSRRNHTATLRCASELAFHSISVDGIAGVLHNKVLVAAGLSAAIGQLSKPFASILLYGKKFDFKIAIQAGGFPSTHSSAAVATATSLVLERGFSDSIFGLAVIYAGLTMYDAQGVRREVGTHAKEINKVLLQPTSYSKSSRNDTKPDSFSIESCSDIENMDPLFSEDAMPKNTSLLLKSDNKMRTSGSYTRSIENVEYSRPPLKESIGHTEIEVVAGAMLGFVVSLAVCPFI